ncbi:MAG: DUF3179 domain-containing protein [Calditrichaeota bacterium]|nr:MAG: DUF3179 domain-containing protein [Calditrichota bacterium]
MKKLWYMLTTAVLVWGWLACSSSTSSGEDVPPAPVVQQENKIYIVDKTGKRWDVTHAEERYGMKASQFQFGLGPNAIPPINNPKFVQAGDLDFPDPNETFLVIGTRMRGEARAYPLFIMKTHEIVNDVFEDKHVAIGY